ncbi:uncharacterized protein [Argopecten irradians]|uniref:uncharacterized protein n=2 Tax=Argopecten irradians TaxID=31199 RepID=UPI0037154EC3
MKQIDARLTHIEVQVNKIDKVHSALLALTIRVSEIENNQKKLASDTQELEQSTRVMSDLFDSMKVTTETHETKIKEIKKQCYSDQVNTSVALEKVCKERNELQSMLTDLQCRSMKSNLVFLGLNEVPREDTEGVVRSFLYNELGITENIDFGNVHRFGKRKSGRPRPIVARFIYQRQHGLVLSLTHKLHGSRYSINEQFPAVVEDVRRKLYPVAKRLRRERHRVKFIRDRMYVDGVLYTGPEASAPQPVQQTSQVFHDSETLQHNRRRPKKRTRPPSTPTSLSGGPVRGITTDNKFQPLDLTSRDATAVSGPSDPSDNTGRSQRDSDDVTPQQHATTSSMQSSDPELDETHVKQV